MDFDAAVTATENIASGLRQRYSIELPQTLTAVVDLGEEIQQILNDLLQAADHQVSATQLSDLLSDLWTSFLHMQGHVAAAQGEIRQLLNDRTDGEELLPDG